MAGNLSSQNIHISSLDTCIRMYFFLTKFDIKTSELVQFLENINHYTGMWRYVVSRGFRSDCVENTMCYCLRPLCI
jgi:hypothetical protein